MENSLISNPTATVTDSTTSSSTTTATATATTTISSNCHQTTPQLFSSSGLIHQKDVHNFDEMFDIFFEDGVLDDLNFTLPSNPQSQQQSQQQQQSQSSFDFDILSPADDYDFDYDYDENDNDEKDERDEKEEKVKSKNSTEDKTERRERNREHAKRSRVRKKMIQESLQKSVDLLLEENKKLKSAILEHLGPDALPVLDSTNSSSVPARTPLTSSMSRSMSTSSTTSSSSPLTTLPIAPTHSNLVKSLQTAQQNFVITDPSLPDNPIIYASHGFVALTGYPLNQILGRNCRFLQGPQTDPRAIESIRHGLRNGLDTTTVILNYRHDGTTFWNQLFIGPLKDSNGNVVNYLGVQCKVSEMYAQAFLKAPNSSTISIANIDAVYHSIMSPPSSTLPQLPAMSIGTMHAPPPLDPFQDPVQSTNHPLNLNLNSSSSSSFSFSSSFNDRNGHEGQRETQGEAEADVEEKETEEWRERGRGNETKNEINAKESQSQQKKSTRNS